MEHGWIRPQESVSYTHLDVYKRQEYISYANCGLPYYIGGVIRDRERLFVQTPEAFARRFRVDVRTASEVTAIDVRRKEVTVRTSDGREYVETYDKLLLSPGASPVRPPLTGIDSRGIFTLRNVQDTDRIKDYVRQHQVRRALIVGGGFIGLEMAENLQHTGAEVAVVDMAAQVKMCIRDRVAGDGCVPPLPARLAARHRAALSAWRLRMLFSLSVWPVFFSVPAVVAFYGLSCPLRVAFRCRPRSF